MIRAAILSLVLIMAGFSSASASECGKLCDRDWWETATQREIAAEIATVDVNARDEHGFTPLHWTASGGTIANITSLLKAGANVNTRNNSGVTPLHWAAVGRKPANIKALLKAGANVNAQDEDGWTPLHRSVAGSIAGMKVLLKAGAKVNARDSDGWTPLHVAALYGKSAKVLALLDAGADGKAKDKFGKTPFDYVKENEELKGTDAYWALNDAQYD